MKGFAAALKVAVGSQVSVVGRAKIVMGCELLGVACSREIACGSVAICGSRAKVCIGCVMLVRRRKFAYRYVMIGRGCSVDYCRLFLNGRRKPSSDELGF